MKKQQKNNLITATLLLIIPLIAMGGENKNPTPENIAQAIEELVDEQPEAIHALGKKHQSLIEDLRKINPLERIESRAIIGALSTYADTVCPEAFTTEERLSNPYWKILLAFFAHYKPTEASYQELANIEQEFLRLIEQEFIRLYWESKMNSKFTVEAE